MVAWQELITLGRFEGQTVIVRGAASGIGLATQRLGWFGTAAGETQWSRGHRNSRSPAVISGRELAGN